MLETPNLIRYFDETSSAESLAALIQKEKPVLFTGEGSSRIFPAKRARYRSLLQHSDIVPLIEGATQAMDYDLSGFTVLGVIFNLFL